MSEILTVLTGPMVRAISATSVIIWAELSSPGTLLLQAVQNDSPESTILSNKQNTVRIDTRYFIVCELQNLSPATWYTYHLATPSQTDAPPSPLPTRLRQCFRTLNQARPQHTMPSLRIAYGSCRKLDKPQEDLLKSFGTWLDETYEEREERWPHLLLLLGDQIYADHPPTEVQRANPHLRHKAKSFADFAALYTYAWTYEEGVRQLFAMLPTSMIFDDHEILNDWGITPTWTLRMQRKKKGMVLVDGLIAYWVYQGWGNSAWPQDTPHPLVNIMREAERDGTDALEPLRAVMQRIVDGEEHVSWHYTIEASVPIFVTNTRANRTSVRSTSSAAIYAETSIMEPQQIDDLQNWMQSYDERPVLLASSVPVLLPPFLGLAEYLMGVRLWQQGPALLRTLGRALARVQLTLAYRTSFDHWPVFASTWNKLQEILKQRRHDILVVSGDVHFSYAVEGRRTLSDDSDARLYQFVSTPIQNQLSRADQRKIEGQAFIKRTLYGGLSTHILPLETGGAQVSARQGLLFQNTLALLTLRPKGEEGYEVEQAYLGLVAGRCTRIGTTRLTRLTAQE